MDQTYTPQQKQAITRLKRLAPEHSTIFARVNYVYPGNTKRIMSFFALVGADERRLDADMAVLFDLKLAPEAGSKLAVDLEIKQGLLIEGAGMDIGLHFAYALGRKLYGSDLALLYDRDR